MKRIVMHWTAGGHKASGLDKEHYHSITEGDGTQVLGYLKPEANENTSDGQYAAHTRALNTGSIGMAMAAMRGAIERPFSAGDAPITSAQLNAFIKQVADMAETYGIPITRQTILTHAEVQPTLGVWQRGKWDIAWLPGLKGPADPVQIGDHLRSMIEKAQVKAPPPPKRSLSAWWR